MLTHRRQHRVHQINCALGKGFLTNGAFLTSACISVSPDFTSTPKAASLVPHSVVWTLTLRVAEAMHYLKLSFSKRVKPITDQPSFPHEPFWQKRYYDRNVRSVREFGVKLRYLHRNPVKRGLVKEPGDWKWSSFRHYAFREMGVVEIESEWTARDRELQSSGGSPRIFLSPG